MNETKKLCMNCAFYDRDYSEPPCNCCKRNARALINREDRFEPRRVRPDNADCRTCAHGKRMLHDDPCNECHDHCQWQAKEQVPVADGTQTCTGCFDWLKNDRPSDIDRCYYCSTYFQGSGLKLSLDQVNHSSQGKPACSADWVEPRLMQIGSKVDDLLKQAVGRTHRQANFGNYFTCRGCHFRSREDSPACNDCMRQNKDSTSDYYQAEKTAERQQDEPDYVEDRSEEEQDHTKLKCPTCTGCRYEPRWSSAICDACSRAEDDNDSDYWEPAPVEDQAPPADKVNSPAHYNQFPVEVIQLTRHMNFNRGNAVKYLCRAGAKDPAAEVEDLKKARWYVDDELQRLTGEGEHAKP